MEMKIIKIVNDFKVIANKGSNDGIEAGMKVLVYELGEELFDPDTNENLGNLEIIKGNGIIVHVQEKMCTIESNMKKNAPRTIRRKNPNSLGSLTNISAMLYGKEEIVEEMPMEPKEFEDPCIGDFIKIINR